MSGDDDDERSGRHLTGTTIKNVEKVQQARLEDQRWTIHNVCNTVKLSHGNCQSNLSDELNVRHIAAKFLSRLMSKDQKEYFIAIWIKIKEQLINDPNFTSKIITSDESWVFGYNPKKTQQSSQWKTPTWVRPNKARSNVQTKLIFFFFDTESNVHKEFVQPLQTVNEKFCCNVLCQLTENIRRKCPDKWRNNSWALRHHNALAQVSLVVLIFFDYYKHDTHPPPSLLTAPRPVIILPIPEDEIDTQRVTF